MAGVGRMQAYYGPFMKSAMLLSALSPLSRIPFLYYDYTHRKGHGVYPGKSRKRTVILIRREYLEGQIAVLLGAGVCGEEELLGSRKHRCRK